MAEPEPRALPPKTMLLEYQLESVLGTGGFGITYLALDTHLEKHVAITEYMPADLALRALDGSVVPVNTDPNTTTSGASGVSWMKRARWPSSTIPTSCA